MRAKKKEIKSNEEGKKTRTPLRRSSRLKRLSVDLSTKTKAPQAKLAQAKTQKVPQVANDTITKRGRGSRVKIKPKNTKQTKQVSQSEESRYVSAAKARKKIAKATLQKAKTKDKKADRIIKRKMKRKRVDVENSTKLRMTAKECYPICSQSETEKGVLEHDSAPSPNEYEKRNFELIKTIKIEQNYYEDENITRYSDVAFLDDNHILALDDNYLRRKQGQRVCCINVDGTFVCDLLVPGYPWSVVVLCPTEAVLTMRGLGSNGLLWISIDIYNRTMEIIRTVPFEKETFGLSYSDRSETFILSCSNEPYMSILNKEGKELEKIHCKAGLHYRCLLLEDDTILFLDRQEYTVSIMNHTGKVLSSLKHKLIREPYSLAFDSFGNIYVESYKSGDLLKFDRNGRHLNTFVCPAYLCAIALDRTSDRIAVASNNCIFVYTLGKKA